VSAPARVEAPAGTLQPCADDARWDALVAASPQGNAFCASWFLRALGGEVDRWVWQAGGKPAALAVVLRDQEGPLAGPCPFTMYQGLMLLEDPARMPAHRAGKWVVEVTQAVLEGLASIYARFSLCLHPSLADLRGLQWFHYGEPDQVTLELRYTGLLSLAAWPDFESYLGGIRTTRRYEHRKGAARGLTVERSEDVSLLDHLHAATFGRQGIARPAHEGELLRAITAAALREKAGELLVCRTSRGEPASATLFIHDARCSYYLFGANAPEHRALAAGTVLVVENVRRALERGLAAVDFCGVNSPNRGDFKTSLGGVVTPYHVARWTRRSS
jgi:hypothetical protein